MSAATRAMTIFVLLFMPPPALATSCTPFVSTNYLFIAQGYAEATIAPTYSLHANSFQRILVFSRVQGEQIPGNSISIRAVPMSAGGCCEGALSTGAGTGGTVQAVTGPTGGSCAPHARRTVHVHRTHAGATHSCAASRNMISFGCAGLLAA